MRIVYDTSVLATIVSRRDLILLLQSDVLTGKVSLITSTYIMDELERVLASKFGMTKQGAKSRTRLLERVADGIFTGGITSYLASRHEKHDAIRHLLQGHQVGGSFAFGDSEGDMEMLAAVENPVCINPNAGLRERAAKHGWPCVEPGQVEAVSVRFAGEIVPDF